VRNSVFCRHCSCFGNQRRKQQFLKWTSSRRSWTQKFPLVIRIGKDSNVKAAYIPSSHLPFYKITTMNSPFPLFIYLVAEPLTYRPKCSIYLHPTCTYLGSDFSSHVANFFFRDSAYNARSRNSDVTCTLRSAYWFQFYLVTIISPLLSCYSSHTNDCRRGGIAWSFHKSFFENYLLCMEKSALQRIVFISSLSLSHLHIFLLE
jgi:hypothetical protein